MTTQFLLAGFGGQGILFAGKFLAYSGLLDGKQVSWLPSYGPEMRGGTANCSVIVSDSPVGSPIVQSPDVLVAMNLPSLDKYESAVAKGGKILVDSSLVTRKVMRQDVTVYYVPATQIASDNKTPTLANMVMMGKLIKALNISDETIAATLKKVVPAKRPELIDINAKILQIGANC